MDASYIPIAEARGFTTHWINFITAVTNSPADVILTMLVVPSFTNMYLMTFAGRILTEILSD